MGLSGLGCLLGTTLAHFVSVVVATIVAVATAIAFMHRKRTAAFRAIAPTPAGKTPDVA